MPLVLWLVTNPCKNTAGIRGQCLRFPPCLYWCCAAGVIFSIREHFCSWFCSQWCSMYGVLASMFPIPNTIVFIGGCLWHNLSAVSSDTANGHWSELHLNVSRRVCHSTKLFRLGSCQSDFVVLEGWCSWFCCERVLLCFNQCACSNHSRYETQTGSSSIGCRMNTASHATSVVLSSTRSDVDITAECAVRSSAGDAAVRLYQLNTWASTPPWVLCAFVRTVLR